MVVRYIMKEILGGLLMDATHVLVLLVRSIVLPYPVQVILVIKTQIVNLDVSV
jgi:hypothetical protein